MPPRAPRVFRPRVALAGALVPIIALGLAIGLPILLRPEPRDPRGGSLVVVGPPVTITRAVGAYSIDYRVEDSTSTTFQHLTIRRPFDSRFESTNGAGVTTGGQLTSFGQLVVLGNEGSPQVFEAPPALAGFDQRLDQVMTAALAAGILHQRERRQVLGRGCQVYRAAGLLAEGLRPFDPEGNTYADICIDEAGLLLEEVWFDQGKLIRRRVATEVSEAPSVDGVEFRLELSATIPVTQGGGRLVPLSPTVEPPGEFYLLDPGNGFVHKGRYVVVPPQGEALVDPTQRNRRQAGVVDVWTKGPDMLLLDRGGTLAGEPALAPNPHARPTDLGALGKAELIIDARSSEVRILSQSRYVRLAGTLQPDELVGLARSITKVTGNGTLGTGP